MELIQQMKEKKVYILGITDLKCKRIDMQILTEDYAIWWSAVEQKERAKTGVGTVINQKSRRDQRIYKPNTHNDISKDCI